MVATELEFVEKIFLKVDQYMETMKTYLQTAEVRIVEMKKYIKILFIKKKFQRSSTFNRYIRF